MPPNQAGEAGFTLLEVLVAFVIAALALGVLFQGSIEGLASVRLADRTTEAVSVARSHLAAVGHGIPLQTATQQGEDGNGFRWSLSIRPLTSAVLAEAGTDPLHPQRETLYEIHVTESWDGPQGPRGTTLSTRRASLGVGS
ncbi:type IV pilus modification PilV family protein [Lichenicoccus roseus]|uniref:type IV pilus modification PilV family protein n=1 Tax=Lichenicoccus roseus TaxID=2683649 RepID=UPI001980F5D5|nr:type II secretion system protein [Lichenicoccus roseus]